MLEAISARQIAVTGMRAQRARINVIAQNIANANTTRTRDGGPFRRQMALFRGEDIKPRLNPANQAGVRVTRIVSDPTPFRTVYQPGHPDANDDGYVSYPNVHLAMEMVDLVSAQRAYDANTAVFLSDRRMSERALEIIKA
jgi:flagellar basal-body rod protein FlgC